VTAVADLETPAVLVDLDVLERNIARMAESARACHVRLRPHAKTHKSPEIARAQLRAGAVGLSLAKTGEAEVFAAAGFEDLFIAYPVVGEDKGRRLLTLSDRLRLAVGVDSLEGAATLAAVFRAARRTLDVRLKVDVGFHRVGVAPEAALATARKLADLPGLRLQGVFTHAGQAYHQGTPEGVVETGRHEGRQLAAVAAELRAAGVPVAEVSVGSTPTARHAMAMEGVTECRPGNYVFHDASQVSLGTCALEDCAMTVLATVVSVPAPDRAVLDAGSKTLSSDALRPRPGGYGWVLEGSGKSRLERLSEEHGVVTIEPGDRFRVGQRVRVLPNHACVVSNLHDRLFGVRADRLEAELPVAARGRVQ
jgi:D-serine deaminase-like pyridoxal phosphate-dependent protein